MVSVSNIHSYTSGSDVGFTGSKGDGGITCVYCHKNSLPIDNQTLDISTNIPTTGYKSDSTYTITVSLKGQNELDSFANVFGFMATVEKAKDYYKIGTLVLQNTTETQIKKNYWITHRTAGIHGDTLQKTWTFGWKAPQYGQDSIRIWACGNVANGGGFKGDIIVPAHTAVIYADTTNVLSFISNKPKSLGLQCYYSSSSNSIIINNLKINEALKIYNLQGEEVYTTTTNNNIINISTDTWSKGTYIIVNKQYISKILIY